MILVTGSKGTFGSAVLKRLDDQNLSTKAVSNSSGFDWNKPETFEGALRGIKKIFLISPPNFADFNKQIIPFIAEAKSASVDFILLSTVYGTDKHPNTTLWDTEKIVSDCGINFAIIRPNFVFQNFINYDLQAIKSGSIYLPTSNAKTSYIDIDDVALACARILDSPHEHIRKIYTLTGSESLSHNQLASLFSSVLETKITNLAPTNKEYKSALLSYDLPQNLVDFMGSLYAGIEAGNFEATTNDFEFITGKKPTKAQEFIELNRSVFTA